MRAQFRIRRQGTLALVLGVFVIPQFELVSIARLPQEHNAKTPASVVKELFAADTLGTRLTFKGWYEEADLFVRPQPFPTTPAITVMTGRFVEGAPQLTGDQAEVGVECSVLGNLDSSLRFTWANRPSEPVKSRYFYTVVFTGDYWKLGEDGRTLAEVKGPPEWKIRDFQSEQVLPVNAVIAYIELHRKSADPATQKNADRSLAILSSYRQ